ncbi:MAG TPA: hypothetical protein VM677_19480 [Actinokineospora sp.]|jgi:hypothetical protein|nr:hypothetical protein [Actinokineospora sp.]
MANRTRIVLFAAVVLAVVGGTGTYLAVNRPAPAPVADKPTALADGPHLLFRDTTTKTLARVALDGAPDRKHERTDVLCDRVHSIGTQTLCAHVVGLRLTNEMYDDKLVPVWATDGEGVPSRTRIAPDGRMAATTVFVAGDSYNQTDFSTRTTLVDPASGDSIADLEQLTTYDRASAEVTAADRNYWGVTFAGGDVFYAAVKYAGEMHIVRGDLATRTMRIIADGGGCPSVSPDGTRVVFKTPAGLSIVDVASGVVRALPETREFDEQVVWLDDSTVLYSVPREKAADVWRLPVDGGAAALYLSDASSPSVVRSSTERQSP